MVVIKNLSISVTSCLISFDLNFVFVLYDFPHKVFPLDSNQASSLEPRALQNCEQFIKFECNNDIAFISRSPGNNYAWWVSRDGTRMNYWGGARGQNNMCACGVTNSCSNSKNCNCHHGGSGWREDSGLLTDKSALPVTQIRLGDLDDSQ